MSRVLYKKNGFLKKIWIIFSAKWSVILLSQFSPCIMILPPEKSKAALYKMHKLNCSDFKGKIFGGETRRAWNITDLQKQRIFWPLHFFKNCQPVSSTWLHDLYPSCQKERQTFILRREAYDAFHQGLASIGHLWRKLRYCLLLGHSYIGTYITPFYFGFLFFHTPFFYFKRN